MMKTLTPMLRACVLKWRDAPCADFQCWRKPLSIGAASCSTDRVQAKECLKGTTD